MTCYPWGFIAPAVSVICLEKGEESCCPKGIPRSRRDKDMSDDKASKPTIKVFRVVEFSISPGEAGQKKVTVTF
jgi:hypothetical protein